jgi:AraC family transcriptional regulator
MNPVAKALWFIEGHFAGDVTLAQIAKIAGVSRFHMVRAFGVTTGHSVMRYVRGRRLTEAAKALANGVPDILTVALDAGEGSHEAFSRAFRDEFGLNPDRIRAAGTVENIHLLEPITMNDTPKTPLLDPRIQDGRPMLLAGFADHFTFENIAGIPGLWQRFREHIGNIPDQVSPVAYGACYNTDDAGAFDYIAAVEVSDFASLPDSFARLRLAKQRYAVFTHTEHISTIRGTFMAIFNEWLPKSGYQNADAAPFERYDERFDGHTGMGGFEIWIPIKP